MIDVSLNEAEGIIRLERGEFLQLIHSLNSISISEDFHTSYAFRDDEFLCELLEKLEEERFKND